MSIWILGGLAAISLTIGLWSLTRLLRFGAHPVWPDVWPLESDGIDIPLDGPPKIIIPMQQLVEELSFALWEDEMR